MVKQQHDHKSIGSKIAQTKESRPGVLLLYAQTLAVAQKAKT
jgi:hypothetical protein